MVILSSPFSGSIVSKQVSPRGLGFPFTAPDHKGLLGLPWSLASTGVSHHHGDVNFMPGRGQMSLQLS